MLLYECVYVYVYGCACVFTQCAKLKFQFCDKQLKNKERAKRKLMQTRNQKLWVKSQTSILLTQPDTETPSQVKCI